MMRVDAAPTADDLVDRSRAGDARARDLLVERHYAAVWSFARKLTRDDAGASDVAQETFLRALSHLDQYDREHRFSSWLFKIAANHVRDLRRRAQREPEPPAPVGDAADVLEKHEDVDRVRRALDALAPDVRAAMILHLQEGLSVPDVAYALALTEHAVRNRIHRALQKVRALVKEAR